MGNFSSIRNFIPKDNGVTLTTSLPGFGMYVSLTLDKQECEEIARQAKLTLFRDVIAYKWTDPDGKVFVINPEDVEIIRHG